VSELQRKNPADSIDFTMSWTNLGGATLSSVNHAMPAGSGLTKVGESNTTSTSTVQISGATHGAIYQIMATATLNNGRSLVRSFTLRVWNE
jgi:hypothetical protein